VGWAPNPTIPPKAPAPPAIVERVSSATEEVVVTPEDVSSEVAVELESVAVEALESVVVVTVGILDCNPTIPPNAPTAPAKVVLLAAASVVCVVSSVLVDDTVSEALVLESVLESVPTTITPATPPKPPWPPAIVTTEPAVGAVSFDRTPT